MTISLFATALSAGISFLAGNSIVNSLVQQSSTSGPGASFGGAVGQFFLGNVESLQVFDLKTLGYALLIAVGIGILGSIGPALIASRLKPAEVIRLE
jgi:ABC-type antimicrobial peptide transport system permease subunit